MALGSIETSEREFIMRNFFSAIVKKLDCISLWSGRLLSFLVLFMVGIIFWEVIMRYFFNRPTTWAMEAATMIFGIYMMGGGVYSLLKDGHVRMDIFYSRWSPRRKAIADIFTFPLFLSFIGILLYKATAYGFESFVMREYSSTPWGPPLYPLKLTVPVIIILMLSQGIANFIRNIALLFTGEDL